MVKTKRRKREKGGKIMEKKDMSYLGDLFPLFIIKEIQKVQASCSKKYRATNVSHYNHVQTQYR